MRSHGLLSRACCWSLGAGWVLVSACGRVSEHDGSSREETAGNGAEMPTSRAGAPVTQGGQPDEGNVGGGAPVPIPTAGTGGAAGSGVLAEGGAPAGGELNQAGAGGESEPPQCDPIRFEDPDLEATVRTFAGKAAGPLFAEDVAGIAYLAANSVTSLKGLECLTALTDLDIGSLPGGKVTDLRPLAGLDQLQTLDISRNPVASLEPLGKLPRLHELFAFHVPVELDLAPLASAPQLTRLDLNGDTVRDLGPLGAVSTLTTLNLRNAQLLHPEGVAAVQSLEDFDATGVFSDAAPLAGLARLTRLRIGGKPLANFSMLGGLVNLRFLDVASTGITTLAPVANMKKLAGLGGFGNQITDVTPLAALPDLSIVVLIGNPITDVGPLAANLGIGAGDFIYLGQDKLACDAQAVNIQAMRARGADVTTDCP